MVEYFPIAEMSQNSLEGKTDSFRSSLQPTQSMYLVNRGIVKSKENKILVELQNASNILAHPVMETGSAKNLSTLM